MTTILKIDASVRRTDNPRPDYNSLSRGLSEIFMTQWRELDPNVEVITRDVGMTPPDFISQDWIAAVFTPEDMLTNEQKELLVLSDTLIGELDRADIVLISSPLYNYGMPAALKAWFDQIVRINKTFTFDLARGDFPLEPILSGKTLVLLTSAGEFGFAPGGVRETLNHLGPHIESVRQYLGTEVMHEIGSEYQEFADERFEKSLANAQSEAKELAAKLVEKTAIAAE